MSNPTVLIGDVRERITEIPDGSVQCVVTSPPYFGLRDYGHDGQIGLETTPQAYVDEMVQVFREVRRVLADDGTLWLNLGDSYAGANYRGGGLDSASSKQRSNAGTGDFMRRTAPPIPPGLKEKDLIGIPWRVAFALQADGWYLRQDIIWSKPNPMPESVKDRCTKSHEYLFLLTKSARYYYDAAAIAEPIAPSTGPRLTRDLPEHGSDRGNGDTKRMKAVGPRFGGTKYGDSDDPKHATKSGNVYTGLEKRNKRSVWSITTKPYKEAHFAVMPEALVEPCILAGSREGDILLDPFAGSGTVLRVAQRLGRHSTGIELNPDYLPLIRQRTMQPSLMLGAPNGPE